MATANQGHEVLDTEAIDALLASSKQRGEYDRELAAFLATEDRGIKINLTNGVFAGKQANSVKTGFTNAVKRGDHDNVRVVSVDGSVALIRTDA